MERPNAWKNYTEDDKKAVFDFADDYKRFLSKCKTERECVTEFKRLAQEAGFCDLKDVIREGRKLKAGDRVYADNIGKNIALFVIGQEPIEHGMNILGAHLDSPRLDLKPNPLYEDTDMALLDTHYYGGIKKYLWVTLPLALHGVIAKKDGSLVQVNIGEDPNDPVVGISDLLIHLSKDLMSKPASEVVHGEDLDVLIGSMPLVKKDSDSDEENAEKDAVKANILAILKERYNIEEEDFLSAEIEVVPAGAARDYGLDRSMIMGYGHDDRSCAYPSFAAVLTMDKPKRTSCCLLIEKEEIGSVGASGMESRFFENTTAELMDACGEYSEMKLRRALQNSKAMSSDVNCVYDPLYASVVDKKNCSFFGRGLVVSKYTGARGKVGSNDASAEFVAELRRVLDDAKVCFQMAELGKVDVGGGGTIAYMLGNFNMSVIDCGVGVLSMHAPWEIISKADLYEAKKGYIAFLNA